MVLSGSFLQEARTPATADDPAPKAEGKAADSCTTAQNCEDESH